MNYKTETYKLISDFIYSKSGIVYSEKEFFRLDSRILSLMKLFEIPNEDDLTSRLRIEGISGDLGRKLIELSTNNETLFFRDMKPFNTLVSDIVPNIDLRPIQIWSAGCSSGQEPYSIAMTLVTHFPNLDFSIQATDISHDILKKAMKAQYSKLETCRGLEPSMLARFFQQVNDNAWEVKNEIKNMVQFSYLNLLSDPYPATKFDIIFCRNVLIYQNYENRLAIIKKFEHCLKDGGVLFLGSGESIVGMDLELKMEFLSGSMVFSKNGASIKKTA